jgi:hypothetical protein
VKLSAIRDRWLTVVVQGLGTVLVPASGAGRGKFKVIRCRHGLGMQAMQMSRLPRGPIHSTDFGMPYVLAQGENGLKTLYQTTDDLSPLLGWTTGAP